MKKILIILMALLCPVLSIAQGGMRITWPLERSVFQRNSSGNANISITGTVGYRNVFQATSVNTQIYQLNSVTGQRVSSTPVSVTTTTSFNNSYPTFFGPTKTFRINISNLGAGWYEAEVTIPVYNNCFQVWDVAAKRTVKFGVGDVFIIAGQSNASGYTFPDDNLGQEAFYHSPVQPDAVTILNSSFEVDRAYINGPPLLKQIKQDFGLPFNPGNTENYDEFNDFWPNITNQYYPHRFDKLEANPNNSSPSKKNGFNNLYPNGQSSWTYGPMAYHLFNNNGNNIPIMLFNSAVPGTHSKAWRLNGDNDWVYYQFRDALQMFGHIYGIKRVLWHQGESDNGLFNTYTTEQGYKDNLKISLVNLVQILETLIWAGQFQRLLEMETLIPTLETKYAMHKPLSAITIVQVPII